LTPDQVQIFYAFFFTVIGGCVGSFLNVVVYRVPLGLSIVTPPSSCPKCDHKLAWFDNVPVLGWIWLRGKCRFCKNPISAQYPIMEAICAALFGGMFISYYMTGDNLAFERPELLQQNFIQTWGLFLVHLFLLGALIASSKVDANLFIIPLEIPWLATLVALIALPLVAWLQPAVTESVAANVDALGRVVTPEAASPVWIAPAWAVGGAIGGSVGLIIAILLLRKGVLPYSFAEEQEEGAKDTVAASQDATAKDDADTSKSKSAKQKKKEDKAAKKVEAQAARDRKRLLGYFWVVTIAALLACLAGQIGRIIAAILIWWGLLIVDFGAYGSEQDEEDGDAEFGPESWPDVASPRKEALKEILFLLFPIVLGVIGVVIAAQPNMAEHINQWATPWRVLCGVAFGYLIGGGLVWLVRAFGTLGFNKEAMGLGDVHLVAAIGAVVGPVDAVLGFFIAPFLGLLHTLLIALFGKTLFKRGLHIPYGPHLAGATILLMAFRTPLVQLLHQFNLPIR
jgi:prepilin signal peptidase PulO-like enzyme (type II secretory pathway)